MNESFTEEELQELKKQIIDKYKSKELIDSAFTQIDLNILKYKLTPIKEINKDNILSNNPLTNTNEKCNVNKVIQVNKQAYDITIKPFKLVKLNIKETSALLNIPEDVIYKALIGNAPNKATNYTSYIIPDNQVATILIKRLEQVRAENEIDSKRESNVKIKVKSLKNKRQNRTKRKERKELTEVEKSRNKEFICGDLLTSIRFINKIIKQKGIVLSKGEFFTEEEYNSIKDYIKSRKKNINQLEKPLKLTTLRRSKVTTPSQSKMTMQAGVK